VDGFYYTGDLIADNNGSIVDADYYTDILLDVVY
jgi:hypothetical protein